MRIVERVENNGYKEINFEELKNGDVFKIYEEDRTPILDELNHDQFVAMSDAYLNKDGIWEIKLI